MEKGRIVLGKYLIYKKLIKGYVDNFNPNYGYFIRLITKSVDECCVGLATYND